MTVPVMVPKRPLMRNVAIAITLSEVGNKSTVMLDNEAPQSEVKASAVVTMATTAYALVPKNGSKMIRNALVTPQNPDTRRLPHLLTNAPPIPYVRTDPAPTNALCRYVSMSATMGTQTSSTATGVVDGAMAEQRPLASLLIMAAS